MAEVIRLHNETFECDHAMNGEVVIVTNDAGAAKVCCQISEGATGHFFLLAEQFDWQDCVKGGVGARDLTISGYAISHPGPSAAHQDAIQIMGGRGITFAGFHALMARGDGRHSAFYVNPGVEALDPPVNVVLEDGFIAGGNNSAVHIGDPTNGVRRSDIWGGVAPVFKNKDVAGVVNEGNRIHAAGLFTEEFWAERVQAARDAYAYLLEPPPPPEPTCEEKLAVALAANEVLDLELAVALAANEALVLDLEVERNRSATAEAKLESIRIIVGG